MKKGFVIRADEQVLNLLSQLAEKKGCSQNKIAVEAIKEYIEREELKMRYDEKDEYVRAGTTPEEDELLNCIADKLVEQYLRRKAGQGK